MIHGAGWLLLAIFVAYAFALGVPLAGAWSRGRWAVAAGWVSVPGALACPLLIPAELAVLRAVAAVISADLAFKMVDFLRHSGRDWGLAEVRTYGRFLVPFPVFAVVHPDLRRRLARPDRPWPHIWRIFGGLIGIAAGLALLGVFAKVPAIRSNFALDHVAMLPAFVLAIESISRVLYGLERLAGCDTTPIVRNAFRSRTVAEFWRRYNGRIHLWLYRNVFLPSGGRHAPARGVTLVFLVSGLFHEVMFDIATSHLCGYQLAFFMIQVPAALASGRIERLARRGGVAGKVLAHGSTILFLAATSVLFFHGVSEIFPFVYAGRSPLR